MEDVALWDYSSDSAAFESVDHGRHHCKGMTEDAACELAIRAFRAARDRETSIGDVIEVWVLRSEIDAGGQNHDRNLMFDVNGEPRDGTIAADRRFTISLRKKSIKL